MDCLDHWCSDCCFVGTAAARSLQSGPANAVFGRKPCAPGAALSGQEHPGKQSAGFSGRSGQRLWHGTGYSTIQRWSGHGFSHGFHDDTLDRVCGVHGRVDAYTFDELRQMRLCGTEETLPLLTEVFDVVQGRQPMIIELKTGPRNNELCEKGLALMRSYQEKYPKAAFCIESFDPRIVAWFRRNAPDIFRGQLADEPKSYEDMSALRGFCLGCTLYNVIARPQFIAYGPGKKPILERLAEAMGAVRVCWTVRPEDDIVAKELENDAVIFEFYNPKPRYK